jgi:ATP-binding cassette, subfamily B (MDR/TAP), member 1
MHAKSLATSTSSVPLVNPARMEFKNVSFAYPGSHMTTVLDNVSFAVRDGETVALVGPSGAGKSSIVALCERFYDTTEGSIAFRGEDMRNCDVRSIRAQMALVSQDADLFPGSIRYNIALGLSHRPASQEEIDAVAIKCGIHDFISSLPYGYATECGSVANSQLSGGQRQRIALARALIRNPEVLLLDEPTSALDAKSEEQVQAALAAASRGRTTIIVAHRLATIQHADKIIVLDGGRIVEQGTHSELVDQGGLYASMAKAQAIA